MTTLWSWSSSADTDPDLFVGAAPAVTTSGSYGQRYVWPSTTAVAYARKAVTALGDHGIRFIYSVASFAGASHMIASGLAEGPVIQWRVDLSTAGLLRIRDATSQITQGTVALAAGVEYRIEIIRSGSTLTVKAYKASDNSLQDTLTGTVGGTALANVAFGNNATVTGTLGSFTIDEMVITNTPAEVGPLASALSATAELSPASSAAPFTMQLTIHASGGTGSYTYQVTNWGDGTTSPAQASPVFNKAIAAGVTPGAKTVSWRVTG